MKSISPLVLSLVLFNELPHCHVSPIVAQTTPCVTTKEAFQRRICGSAKSPNNLFPFFCSYSRLFFPTVPHKTYTTLSQSQYISTICFETAVYNNPPPCHNPFKGTKKKAVLPEDYFFQSLEEFCFGMLKVRVRLHF